MKQKQKRRPIQPLISDSTPFQVKEAFKTLRTNLLFTLAASDKKTIVVSSSTLSEGKSTICANLALSMSQTGARVLIIDADLRKPMQNRLFKLDNTKGLSSILCGTEKIEQAMSIGVYENLDVITSGTAPPNPMELLGISELQRMLSVFEKIYDYIFIDTPPINIVSDALVVSKNAAGILLVARQNKTTHQELARSISSTQFAEIPILGIILNDIIDKNHKFGYGKYKNQYKYGYKYGNKYGYSKDSYDSYESSDG